MHRLIPWLIPPLLGLGGYLIAGAGVVRPPAEQAAHSAKIDAKTPRMKGISDFGEELRRLEEEWQRPKDIPSPPPSNGLTLRADILEQMEKLKSLGKDPDWLVRESILEKIELALRELSRLEGGDALAWVNEHVPDTRGIYMDSWAEKDPEGALLAVIASKRKPPCTYETLARLLQSRAISSPAALRDACDQIPWELFCRTVAHADPFAEWDGITLPEEAELGPWLESGAAEALAKQGVTITNLFSLWARENPGQALARTEDWPGEDPSPGHLVNQIFFAGKNDEDVREGIAAAFDALSPEKRERIMSEVKASPWISEIVALYPGLEDGATVPEGHEEPNKE